MPENEKTPDQLRQEMYQNLVNSSGEHGGGYYLCEVATPGVTREVNCSDIDH